MLAKFSKKGFLFFFDLSVDLILRQQKDNRRIWLTFAKLSFALAKLFHKAGEQKCIAA